MLLTEEVEMNITSRNVAYYRKKGYPCNRNDILKIKVFDLPEGSNYVVNVLCDFCKIKEIPKEYYRYLNERNEIALDCCNNKECKSKKINLVRKMPLEVLISNIEKENYKFISVVGEYKNNRNSLILECPGGHQLSYYITDFQQGRRCSICAGTYQPDHTFEEVFEYFESKGCQLLETEYINNKLPLRYICSCGNVSKICYSSFLQGRRCQVCGGNKKYTYEEVYNIFKINGYQLISKEYNNNKELLDYICPCGHSSQISLTNFLRGIRCNECYRENNKGENHPWWNPNITDEERTIKRSYNDYKIWRDSVLKRDNFTCQCCGDNTGGNLQAHHKDGYNWCKERRLDVDNGITLCENCHSLDNNSFHKVYGCGNNTELQFITWINNKKTLELQMTIR